MIPGASSSNINTIGVLIASWAGVFLADLSLRRKPYVDGDLFTSSGRYGSVQIMRDQVARRGLGLPRGGAKKA